MKLKAMYHFSGKINQNTSHKFVEFLNDKFEKFGQSIRLVDLSCIGKSFNFAKFNNESVISDSKNWQKFKRRFENERMLKLADNLCSLDEQIVDKTLQEIRREISSIGGKKLMQNPDNHVHNRSKNKNTPHWNKGSKGLVKCWSKGLIKDTDDRLRKIAEQRSGENNPMYGKKLSDSAKDMLSQKVKEKIENGSWTPYVHNSKTHWEIEYKNKKFRSSWEALFYSQNENLDYEKLRIRYYSPIECKEKIYIVDFCDYENKIIYEIKPNSSLSKDKIKIKAGEKWAKENGFKFVILTEELLRSKFENSEIDYQLFNEETSNRIKRLLNK